MQQILQLVKDFHRVSNLEPRGVLFKLHAVFKYIYWHAVIKHTKKHLLFTQDGIHYYLDTKSDGSAHTFFQATLEYQVTWLFKTLKLKDKTVFDIGANLGNYSLLAHKYGASVYSFEPNAEATRLLKINSLINNYTNISIIEKAVSEKSGVLNFYKYPLGYSGLGSLIHKSDLSTTIQVNTISIDEFCKENGLDAIYLMKIDVEGSELDVFKGAQNSLKNKKVQFIVWETNLENQERSSEAIKLLKSFGYTSVYFDPVSRRLEKWQPPYPLALSFLKNKTSERLFTGFSQNL